MIRIRCDQRQRGELDLPQLYARLSCLWGSVELLVVLEQASVHLGGRIK